MIDVRLGDVLRRSRRERAIDLLFLLPTLVILAGFLFYPLVYGIVLSLHDTQGFDLTTFVGLDHYARAILGDAVFHRSLLNTVLFTGVAVVLQTGLGLFLAVLVADVKRGQDVLPVRVLRALRPRPGGGRRGLEVPVRAVLRDRGHGRVGPRVRHARRSRRSRTPTRRCGRSWPPSCGGSPASTWSSISRPSRRSRASTTNTRVLEGASRFQQFRRITWPLLWPQTFALVLLTTLGTLRIFDMVWIMTAGGPSHATETVATDVYVTAFRFLEVGYAQAMAMILLVVILLLTVVEYRLLESPRRVGELVTRLPRPRWSTVLLSVLAVVWLYPVVWTLTNAVKPSADIYRAPWDLPWPPAIGQHRRGLEPRAARRGAGELGST